MKRPLINLAILACLCAVLFVSSSWCSARYGRSVRPARDITPENCGCARMDWRYGATDICIQTNKVVDMLMSRWFYKTGFNPATGGLPRIIITEVDNRTDQYIATDMIRDTIEGMAINDGRYVIVVGDTNDARELDGLMNRILRDPKYNNSSRLVPGQATAPQFLAKIRLTKAVTSDRRYDYEDYRMTVTLYDIETQEAIDSAWDTLQKKVRR